MFCGSPQEVVEMGPLPNKLADGSGIVNASCGNNRIKPRFQKLAPLVRGVSTDQIISLSVCGIVAITMILGFFLQRLSSELSDGEWWAVLVVIVLVLVLVILYGLIAIHEEVVTEQRYKVSFLGRGKTVVGQLACVIGIIGEEIGRRGLS